MRCSGILPRRLLRRGGASVVRHDAAMNRMEIPDAKPCKETVCKEVLSQVQAYASQNKPVQPAVAPSDAGKKAEAASKQSRVIAMLQSSAGTTIAAMMQAT